MIIGYSVNTIYIIPGDACNLSCVYCSQHELHEGEHPKAEVNPKIYDYIKQIAGNQNNRVSIVFFGGEPLVYWEQIKEIIDNLIGFNVRFSIVTNGVLINEEMVKFFNKYNINIQLSWDGEKVLETRGVDVMKDNEKNIIDINSLCLSGVTSAKNYPMDFVQICDIYNMKYYSHNERNKNLAIHFDYIRSDRNPDLTDNIDMEKWEDQIAQLVQYTIEYHNGQRLYTTAVGQIKKIWQCVRNGEGLSFNAPRCGTGTYSLHLGIDGTIYACHNDRYPVGDINTSPLDIVRNVARVDPTPEVNKKCECFNCDAGKLCCNCYYQMTMDTRRRYYCDMMLATIRPVQERQGELDKVFNKPGLAYSKFF